MGAATLVGVALVATPADARDLPRIAFLGIGFHEMTAAEAVGSGAQGSIALSADLTGDGIEDEGRVLLNPAQDRALLVVVASTPTKADTFVLRDTTVAQGRRLRISLTSAEGRPALLITSGAGGNIEQFDGEEFRAVGG